MAIRSLLLDFGGCIDAPGIHTRTLFWRAFASEGVMPEGQREIFQEAYTMADQRMMKTGEAKAMGLSAFNRFNARIISETLGLTAGAGDRPADWVTAEMSRHIESAKPALRAYGSELPLGIISNFTGNLEVILEEFSIRTLFSSVTESFYAGSSKPDLKIFYAALAKQPFPPGECLYVGDNPKNDIDPAKSLGIKTALIYEESRRECGADAYIRHLSELAPHLKSL
jgi:putative hydrolase of the HAD superfamily